MLDVGLMATLREVVRRGSFSGAAEALALSQPAVSRQVALLERRVGQQLVVRTRQGVQPTAAGTLLCEHADVVLGRLALAEEQLAELAGVTRGVVRMGLFFTALAHLGPMIRAECARRHPELSIEGELVDRKGSFRGLLAGELDLAIVFERQSEPSPPPPEIRLETLFAEPLLALLPAGHPQAANDTVRVGDLAGDTWIQARGGGGARLVDHVLRTAGVAPARVLRSGDGEEPVEAQGLVAAGMGVTVVHELGVWIGPPDVEARPVEGGPRRNIQAAILRDQAAPGVMAVLEVCRDLSRPWNPGEEPTSTPRTPAV
jgi:DNA-binding transcriptional LysR family regulator